MSLQKSVFVYNLSNSVLRYCLWLAPSCHAGKEDALFYIPASGDISCSLRGNTAWLITFVFFFSFVQDFLITLSQSQILFERLTMLHQYVLSGNVSFVGAVLSFAGSR